MDNQNMDSQIPPVEPKAQTTSGLNKGLIIVLSAGIVILLGAVVYLLTVKKAVSPVVDNNQLKENQELAEGHNQSPTADWRTYRNEQCGFEFKYPGNYSLKEGKESADSTDYYIPVQSHFVTTGEQIVIIQMPKMLIRAQIL